MVALTLKIEEEQLELLNRVSKETHVPKSVLIRQGIDLILRQTKEDLLTPGLRQEIEALLTEDREVLKRLAE